LNHVNVATSFRKLLHVSRGGVLEGTVQQVLDALEKSAIKNIEAFQPQQIANILHVMAKKPCKTSLLPELERRTEAMSGRLNSQEIANTLWAFSVMGTKPGERMMGQLERRAEAISGEFKPQEVANTLWGRLRRWGQSRGSG
jgi:hypothetical protein